MAVIEAKAEALKWSEGAKWVGGVAPTTGDTAVIPSGAKVTVTAAAKAAKVEVTGTGLLKLEKTLTIDSEATAGAALSIAGTATIETTSTGVFAVKSNAGVAVTIDSGGKDLGSVTANAGTVKLASNNLTASTNLTISGSALFDFAGFNATAAEFVVSSNKTVKFGSGTIKATGGTGAVNLSSSTIEPQTSVLEVTGTGATVSITAEYKGEVIITGDKCNVQALSGGVETLKLNCAGGANGVIFTAGGKYKVTTLTTNAKSGAVLKLKSGTKGAAWKLSKAAGTLELDYVEIEDSTAEGGATFKAGPNPTGEVDKGGNTGWTFLTGGPATIPLAAAASSSTATMAATATTQVPLVAGASEGQASSALTARTQVVLEAATSQSVAASALTAQTQVPLSAGASSSTASLTATATTQIILAAAASASNAQATIITTASIPLQSATSTSNATIEVRTGGKIVPLQAAVSTSNATASVLAATQVVLTAGVSSSNAAAFLSAKTQVPLSSGVSTSNAGMSLSVRVQVVVQPALSTSTATIEVTASGAMVRARIVIANRSRTQIRIVNRVRGNVEVENRPKANMEVK